MFNLSSKILFNFLLFGSSSVFAAISNPPYNIYPIETMQYDQDLELTNAIEEKLKQGRRLHKYENVFFSVSYGNVTLTGYVETLSDKTQITRDILGIKGVRQIDNQLTVQKAESKYQ